MQLFTEATHLAIDPLLTQLPVTQLPVSSPTAQLPTQLPVNSPTAQLPTQLPVSSPTAQLPTQLPIGSSTTQSQATPDPVIQRVRTRAAKARELMVRKHSKNHVVIEFAIGDIIAVKLPRGVRTSTDNRKMYGKVRGIAYGRYEIQTTFGILSRLVATKDLAPIPLSVATTIEVNGPNKQILLSKAAKLASTSERVVISCKCRGQC